MPCRSAQAACASGITDERCATCDTEKNPETGANLKLHLSYGKRSNKKIETELYIVETDNRIVISLEACKQLKLIKVLHNLKTNNEVSGCAPGKIEENYKKVFQGLGKLEESYHISMDLESAPVTHAPRKTTAMLRSKLKDELDLIIKVQVIVKVEEPTEWVHNPVIVEKPNGKGNSESV